MGRRGRQGNVAIQPSDCMTGQNARFDHLDRSGRLAAFMALRPRLMVNLVVALAALVSWAAIAAIAIAVAQRGLPVEAGPGVSLLGRLPELPVPQWARGLVALCVGPANLWGGEASGFALAWLMWSLMAVATMLPSAAPMIRTYCEIADTAVAKGEAVVHPLVLVAGYLSVWIAAAAAFAGLTVLVQGRMAIPVAGFVAPAALAAAGLYQFSGLKEACLKKCRNPFAVLFARWSVRPGASSASAPSRASGASVAAGR